MPSKLDDILGQVVNTPMVEVKSLTSPEYNVFAKLEWKNPFDSIKARPAVWMIKAAVVKGLISGKNSTIIEPTSGNTGIALAGIAKSVGFHIEIVIPQNVSKETKDLLRSLGAKLLETDDDLCPRVGVGTDQSIALAESMVKGQPQNYYMPNQYDNDANYLSHYESTGPEIWRDTKGGVTHFIAGVGTGGTLTGVGKYLKEKNPRLKVFGVQPEKSHHLQGLRNLEESSKPSLLLRREEVIDEWFTISDKDAFGWVRILAEKEHLLVGPSSGAVMAAIQEIYTRGDRGTVVTIFGDSGRKYKSVYKNFKVILEDQFEDLLRDL
ncbi:MAG: cysteine synthase family protein [Thaumarchaeota archaeon]|nr:cysteine synthase family protein [Nitrososphaerota archaeon]